MFLTSVSTSHHCHWSFFPTFLVLFVQILQFLTRRQWVGPHSTMKNIQKINKFPQVVSIFLVSLVKRSQSRHELKQFPAKKTGFWLANLSGLPIRGLFFWRETTWTHVLTRISEKTDFGRFFVRNFVKDFLHLLLFVEALNL